MNSKPRQLRRHEIFDWICYYAEEHNGVTPSLMAIARQFVLAFSTVRSHIVELDRERLIRFDERQIIVLDSEWTPPPTYPRG